jgi:uncharacterized protein YqfA (UPF0365 family)
MEFLLGIATTLGYIAYKASIDEDRKAWNDRQQAIKQQQERHARVAEMQAKKQRASFVMPPTLNNTGEIE